MNRLSKLSLFALGMLVVAACGKFEGALVSVSPKPLEVHADTIQATVKATIQPKKESNVRDDVTYYATFVIKDTLGTGSQYTVGNATMNGADYPNIEEQGAAATEKIITAYDEGMNGRQLVAVARYERKGKSEDLPQIFLTECCITTSRLLYVMEGDDAKEAVMAMARSGEGVATFGYDYTQSIPVNMDAEFQFPKNVWKIQKDEYDQEDITAIGEFLASGYTATNINLEGFASPEGPYARNQFLSVQRSEVVQDWLIAQLKEAGYDNYLDSNFFSISTTSEDWEGFKSNLDQTEYSAEVKTQIVEIVASGLEEDEKEAQIMALVGGKNQVEFILAPLRRTTIMLTGAQEGRSDEEIQAMVEAFNNGDISGDSLRKAFGQEEFLYAVSMVDDEETRVSLLQEYVKAYPDDHRGHNNLAVEHMKSGDMDSAYDHLRQANQNKPNDPNILNNMAMVQAARGDMEGALATAESSYDVNPTPVAAFFLGTEAHQRARYSRASSYFEEAEDFPGASYNEGLSKLLNSDLAGAKASLEEANESTDVAAEKAWGQYVLAIVGARSGDTDLMITNLTLSVKNNSEMAARAASDLEFKSYWGTAEFQAATKP